MSRDYKKQNKRKELPVIQGNLVEDSITELCSTQRYKTTFDLTAINSGKLFHCVYWGYLNKIKKGQLVVISGFNRDDSIICDDVKQINSPYKF